MVVRGTMELSVSRTESSDAEPGSSVLVVWTAVVVNVPLSARRVLLHSRTVQLSS